MKKSLLFIILALLLLSSLASFAQDINKGNVVKTNINTKVGETTDIYVAPQVYTSYGCAEFTFYYNGNSVGTLWGENESSLNNQAFIAKKGYGGACFINFTAKKALDITIHVKYKNGVRILEEYYIYVYVTCDTLLQKLSLNKSNLTLNGGYTETLTATKSPSNANAFLQWSSSNTNVATVDANGKITAKSAGETVITVEDVNSGIEATCNVKVNDKLGIFYYNENDEIFYDSNLELLNCEWDYLYIKLNGEDIDDYSYDYITWKVKDKSIVEIDKTIANDKVIIKGLKAGSTTVYATNEDGMQATLNVIVSKYNINNIKNIDIRAYNNISDLYENVDEYEYDDIVLYLKEKKYFEVIFDNGKKLSPDYITFNNEDKNILNVENNGYILANISGETSITVTLPNGVSDTVNVKVPELNGNIMILDEFSKYVEEITTNYGWAYGLNVSKDGKKVSNTELIWKSSDNTIATLTKNGWICPKGYGTTTVYAINPYDYDDYDSIDVVIPYPTSIEIYRKIYSDSYTFTMNYEDFQLESGSQEKLYVDAKNLTWSSSNSKIVTVGIDGKVKAVGAGTVIITAKYNDNISDTIKITVPKVYVTNLTVIPTKLNLFVGNTSNLIATVLPENATNKKVTWQSSNTKVATVTSSGVVKGISNGTAKITATTVDTNNSGNKLTATCSVTVKVPLTSLKLTPTSLSLNKGKTYTLKPSISPTTAYSKTVTWKSSNTKVATVSANGVVKAIGNGTATITATTSGTNKNGNKLTATCKVTVKVPVTSVKLSSTSLSLVKGKTSTLKATVYPTNATNKTVTWKSSNTKVASVSTSGVVKGIAKGTAVITVTTKDGNKIATCKVTVTEPVVKVTGIKLSKTSLSLAKGKTATLTATVLPTNATNKVVTWKSSNTKIATVSSKGLVKAVAKGTATITVTTKDGSKKATCKVTVK